MKNEIACRSREVALQIASLLMEEEYVVMLSREEQLTIVNYLWTSNGSNRNYVAFESREEGEFYTFEEIDKLVKEVEEDTENWVRRKLEND